MCAKLIYEKNVTNNDDLQRLLFTCRHGRERWRQGSWGCPRTRRCLDSGPGPPGPLGTGLQVSIDQLSLLTHCQCCQLADISVSILILLRKNDRMVNICNVFFLFLLQQQKLFPRKTVKNNLAEYGV
jgi:hypothetical protein